MHYLGLDFGAGSGRAIVGSIENNKIVLEEIHRFPNKPVKLGRHYYWNFPTLLEEIKSSIKLATKKYDDVVSLAVDTWGVDFGLLDKQGNLAGLPYCYRDNRTAGILDKAFQLMPKEKIYAQAGIQFMEINSAFQLLTMTLEKSEPLSIAKHLLFTPDLFNYFLTGEIKNEYTISSTSNFLNAKTKTWCDQTFEGLKLPRDLMNEVVFPGTVIGKLTPSVCEELNCPPLDVVCVGSHDTASAAAIVLNAVEDAAFISSGTWSIMGISIPEPILTREAMESNFTNEGGVNNTIRFMRNITGLWILQRVIQEWAEERLEKESPSISSGYQSLMVDAQNSDGFKSLIDVDDPGFVNPPHMSKAIAAYCQKTNQAVPRTRGEFARIIVASLAKKYKEALDALEKCTHKKMKKIKIIGGGSQNQLLNQLTADACSLPVIAGPVEATAIGNILTQAIAMKEIDGFGKIKEIVANSFELREFKPRGN